MHWTEVADCVGLEMGEEQAMSIKQQVQYLIEEATEPKNLAQGE